MPVFDDIKKLTGTRYHRAEHNGDVLDDYYLRAAKKKGVRLPTANDNKDPEYINYLGAFIETPSAGLNDHVVYLDLASLYPSIILALNVSPETVVGVESNFQVSEYSEDEVVWGYVDTRDVKWLDEGESWRQYTNGNWKMIYDPHARQGSGKVRWTTDEPQYERCYFVHPDVQEGMVPSLVNDLIDLKYSYSGSLYEAIKRITNSVYGTLSEAGRNKVARLYDWRMAESITLTGRKVIQFTRDTAIERLQDRGYTDAYAAAGDTDGTAISLPPAESWEDCMDDVLEVVEVINEEDYPEWMHETFGVDRDAHHMEVETESYARRLFVPAENPSSEDSVGSKKRYAQWVQWDDDCAIDERIDEIDFTGFECVRSDTADATTELQEHVLESLVRKGMDCREELFEYLREHYEDARRGEVDPSWLARRSGMSKDPSEYGTPNRTPQPVYRGAKWSNRELGTELGEGSKPKYYAVESVGPYRSTYRAKTAEDGDVVDYISLPQSMDVPSDITIDFETMTNDAIVGPLRPVIRTMRWGWDDIKTGTVDSELSAFM